MSKYLDKSKEVRAITEKHYNCAQGAIVPFAEGAGLDEETAYKMTSCFGSGMRMGSVCGAITGGLMVLGLYGADDPATTSEYFRRLKENHGGAVNCVDLLRIMKENGEEKKAHCDGMVFEAVALVEEILKEKGLIDE